MPIYTYRCDNCGIQFDKTQKFSDPVLTKCPDCGKKSLKKVYTPVGIVFKGSGFYATDHRSSSWKNRSTSSKTEETKSETKVETKTESSANTSTTGTASVTETAAPTTSDKA